MIPFQDFYNILKKEEKKLFVAIDDLMETSPVTDDELHYSEAFLIYNLVKHGRVDLQGPQGQNGLVEFCYKFFQKTNIPKNSTIVRSHILKEILIRSNSIFKNRIRNITIKGAEISSSEATSNSMDLSGIVCNFLVRFHDCHFSKTLNLERSVFGSLELRNCNFTSGSKSKCLKAHGLHVKGPLKLIENRYHQKVLQMQNMLIEGSLLINNGDGGNSSLETDLGQVDLIGLVCKKDVNIINCYFSFRTNLEYAINIRRSEVDGNLSLRYLENKHNYEDFLHMQNTSVKRNFIIIDSKLHGIEYSICSSGSKYNAVILNDENPSNITGKMDFSLCNIQSDFDLTRLTLTAHSNQNALELNESIINGSVRLHGTENPEDSFKCYGCIEMNYIQVGNQVNFSSSKIETNAQYAIRCKNGNVKGRITFSPEFIIHHQFLEETPKRIPAFVRGKISFVGTSCKDMDLSDLDVSVVTETLEDELLSFFKEGQLSSSKLQRHGHTLKNAQLYKLTSIDLKHIRIAENLFLNEGPVQGWKFVNNGIIDARESMVGRLNISSTKLCEESSFLRISGMQYEFIIDESRRKERLAISKLLNSWWNRPKENVEECGWFRFIYTKDNLYQPYEQLSRAFNNIGDHPKSRFVRFVGFQVFNPYSYAKSVFYNLPHQTGLVLGHIVRFFKFLFVSIFFLIYETGVPAYRSVICILLILLAYSFNPDFDQNNIASIFSFDQFHATLRLLLPFYEMESTGNETRPFLRVLGIIYIALFVVDISQLNKRGKS